MRSGTPSTSERLGLFEGADDEGHEVRRHLHRGREADRALAVAEVGVRGDRRVGVRGQVLGTVRFTWYVALKAGSSQHGKARRASVFSNCVVAMVCFDARRVGERRAVEAVQLVVQDAVEGDLQDGRTHGQRGVERVGRDLVRLVQVEVDRAVRRAADRERRRAEVEFDGVQLHFFGRLDDVDVDLDAPGESRRSPGPGS